MIRLGLIGFGKMGRQIEGLAEGAGFEIAGIFEDQSSDHRQPVSNADFDTFDVFVDFTHPSVVKNHIELVLKAGKPLVVGTTGWYDHSSWAESVCAETGGTLVYGSNFSLGMQLFFKLAEQAGRLFPKELFHASVHEVHHIEKADAPGGTAKTLGNAFIHGAGRPLSELDYPLPAGQKPDPDKLYVTSERNSSIVGEHRLRIGNAFDDIELIHRAHNRDAFARGALQTARWAATAKPGFYLLENIVDQVLSVERSR